MQNLSGLFLKISTHIDERAGHAHRIGNRARPMRAATRRLLARLDWVPSARRDIHLPRWKQRLSTRRIFMLTFCGQSILAGMGALGMLPALFLSVLAVSSATFALGLALSHARSSAAGAIHPLDLEALVQVRTARLLATNARLAAEIAACKKSAAAVASEHAHLVEQAKEIAAAEERARLARDLHDSVTQTLYSASLIAQVLPVVWQRSPAEGERNLIKLRQLVRGALAEMRTLLFELRPAALDAADLGVLLQQLGDVLTGHTRIPVAVTVEGAAELPTQVKIAAYRIAQEAFNNIAKHAGASQVDVMVRISTEQLHLHVRDNGRGFDRTQVPGERMGVRIMAERAAGIGARFNLTSAPGRGTTVTISWHKELERESVP